MLPLGEGAVTMKAKQRMKLSLRRRRLTEYFNKEEKLKTLTKLQVTQKEIISVY
jgi:hypothetical protein